jgi:methionyl aminopeptidase
MLTNEELEAYRRAGKIAAEVREQARLMVKPGESLLTIAEQAENLIREKGAAPAFPCNISINEIAAHYTPPAGDKNQVKEGDLVKLDIGAHLDGYIGDTAVTIPVGRGAELVQAAERALEEGIKCVKPGVDVVEIGGIVEETVKGLGFKPIRNLTGHGISRWDLHAGLTIPNVKEESEGRKLEEGEVIALEPFVTDGDGEVKDLPQVHIMRFIGDRPLQSRMAVVLLRDIKRLYNHLPFAKRWLSAKVSRIRLELSLRELIASGVLHPYHVLSEREGSLVAQAEHTLLVTADGCEILTA